MPNTRGAILASVAAAATTIGIIGALGTAILHKTAGNTARPTPAPEFADFNSASRASVLAYARSLSFSTAHGTNDTRRLSPACRTCPAGPIATIDPENGSHVVPMTELAKGRIIARLISHDSVSMPGLSPYDTTYIWVDSIQNHWRAMLVPTRSNGSVLEKVFVVNRHPGMRWSEPEARWVWHPDVGVTTMDVGWTKCSAGCCEVYLRPKP